MTDLDRSLYHVEQSNDDQRKWRVVGPNGLVNAYNTEREAQAKADDLNMQVAEEREDDA